MKKLKKRRSKSIQEGKERKDNKETKRIHTGKKRKKSYLHLDLLVARRKE
jgi:hypothetical protein